MQEIDFKNDLVINDFGIDRLPQHNTAFQYLFGQTFFHELLLSLGIIRQGFPTRERIIRKQSRYVNHGVVVFVSVVFVLVFFMAQNASVIQGNDRVILQLLLAFLLPPQILLIQLFMLKGLELLFLDV